MAMDAHARGNLFPVLKNATILQIMEEVEVPLTEAELTEPGRCRERVREVFSQLLQICWGLTPQTLASLPSRITDQQSKLAHPSIYDDALPEAKFFCLLSDLLRTCGYREFGFRDLAAPQHKRFRRQLSALINFLKYREDMGHLEAQAMEEREELFAALDEVTENHMTLKAHLERSRALAHEQMLERAEAEDECKEMEAEVIEKNNVQKALRHEATVLKKAANELKDEIANMAIALRELQGEERRLGREVVECPDMVKIELARANELLETTKREIVEAREEGELVKRQQMATSAAEEGVKAVMATMDGLEERARAYDSLADECESVKERLEAAERDLDARKGEREVRKRSLAKAEKLQSDTVAALAKALENARGELKAATGQLGAVEAERLDGIARVEASERRVEEMRVQIEEEQKLAEEEVAKRIASFHKFEEAYLAKQTPLHSQMGYLG